jgi:hypothetical protein
MKKLLSLVMLLIVTLVLPAIAAESNVRELKVGDQVYVCNCGEKCPCDSMANKPGKCNCGKEMVQGTVTKAEPGTAMIKTPDAERSFKTVGKYACDCGPGCDCGSISQNPSKCVCGKEMKEVKAN